MTKVTLDVISTHLKSYGFFYANSQIYGGLANSFDTGPLGALMATAVRDLWIRHYIHQWPSMHLLDSKIIYNPQVWSASGHINRFHDTLIEEENSRTRMRLDHLLAEVLPDEDSNVLLHMSNEEIARLLNQRVSSYCGRPASWGIPREFNLLFESSIGTLADDRLLVYLRPETAQGVYINYRNILRSMRARLPFGVGQIGKAFRNEITPGHFIFRTREFEQMELEFFCAPDSADKWYNEWINRSLEWLYLLGIPREMLRVRAHSSEELAHYSSNTSDIEFDFPFGWGECLGIANRSNYDLTQHQNLSGVDMSYLDPVDNTRYIPHIVEVSIGLERLILAILSAGYRSRNALGEESIVLSLSPLVAPYQVAVLPLLRTHREVAEQVRSQLSMSLRTTYDHSGSIGRRYRRQDAIGTPWCITIDDTTLTENTVTIRERDSMEQLGSRVAISEINSLILRLINDYDR